MAARSVDSNDSDCFVCLDGGELLCCDSCVRAFHETCLTPALDTSAGLPDGDWSCPICSGFGQGKFVDGAFEGMSAGLREDALGSVRTRATAKKSSDGSELESLKGKGKAERLEGLNSPLAGRGLLGKLSPVTPGQNGEGVGGRNLRKRAGKDEKQEVGDGRTRKKRAQENGGLASGVAVKEEASLVELGYELEVDLRTPDAKEKKGVLEAGGESAANVRGRNGRLAATFEQTKMESTSEHGTCFVMEVKDESVQELVEDDEMPFDTGVHGFLHTGAGAESSDDEPIASRGRAQKGKKQIKADLNGATQEAHTDGDPEVVGLAGQHNGVTGQSDGVTAPEEKVKKSRPPSRKRKITEPETDGGAGPSGTAGQQGGQLAPAGAPNVADEPPRNRRRNRRAPAGEEVPGGAADGGPAGGGGGDDQGDRARARFLAIARRRAAHFAHFAGDEQGADVEDGNDEAEDAANRAPAGRQVAADDSAGEEPDWPGPFSTARKLVREREAVAAAREGEKAPGESSTGGIIVDWTPSRTLDLAPHFERHKIPSLFDLSVRLLVENAEFVESMEGIPDAVRRRVAAAFCARRKMIPETLSLFFRGAPGEIVLPDCTLVGETEMTAAMAQTDAQRLENLELGMCGRCITDQGLSATLASGLNTLPQLSTLSLRGAYRLTDSAVEKLLTAAPGVTSLELRRCSLMSDDVMRVIADALGGGLRGLSLEGCAQLDGARIQPNLLRLTGLRRLNLTNLTNVTDSLVQELSVTLGSSLEELSLAGAKELSDASVAAIAACCPNLTLLDLDGSVKLSDVAIARLADGCRGMRHLSLKLGKCSDEALAAYVTASGGQLRHLCLNNVRKAGDATLVALAKHARDSLTSLDVSWCRKVSDNGLGLLADSCRNLRSLRLFGCSQVTDVFLSGHSNENLVTVGQGDDVK